MDKKAYNRILKRIMAFYKGDRVKATDWMLYGNPNLGGLSPVDLIQMGKGDRLERAIVAALDENIKA